jgi:hypothetical protein
MQNLRREARVTKNLDAFLALLTDRVELYTDLGDFDNALVAVNLLLSKTDEQIPLDMRNRMIPLALKLRILFRMKDYVKATECARARLTLSGWEEATSWAIAFQLVDYARCILLTHQQTKTGLAVCARVGWIWQVRNHEIRDRCQGDLGLIALARQDPVYVRFRRQLFDEFLNICRCFMQAAWDKSDTIEKSEINVFRSNFDMNLHSENELKTADELENDAHTLSRL